MNILHAFWQPEPTEAFAQVGNFLLWVETAETLQKPASPSQHPRQLPKLKMKSMFAELGIVGEPGLSVTASLSLPSSNNTPLPCPELLPFMDTEYPGQAQLQEWQLDCWKLTRQPIASLNELHFQALFHGQELLPGNDFLFWHWFSQSLKAVMIKDSYVPALRLKASGKNGHELHAGWEFVTAAYGELIREAVEYLPPSAAPGYEPGQPGEPLRRGLAASQRRPGQPDPGFGQENRGQLGRCGF